MKHFKHIGLLRVAFLLALSPALAACVTTGEAGSTPASQHASVAAAPSDAVANFATSASYGTSGTVQMASGRQAKVQVGGEYISAAGDRCKRVLLTDLTLRKTQVSAVCLTDSGWSTVIGL
jgi:hypothetical protein